MKVFNLRCTNQHFFEGWFASESAYQLQLGERLLECPFCGSYDIARLPSAPRFNMGKSNEPIEHAAPSTSTVPTPGLTQKKEADLQTVWMQAVKHVLANTEDVGHRFAQEVRGMHYGEIKTRPVRGQASEKDKLDLQEEGIEVLSLPLPAYATETLQ